MKLFGKIILSLLGAGVGVALLLLGTGAYIVCSPSARTSVLEKGVEIANEKTDYDIDLGRLYLSPFHHSPKLLYRAYKGEADLPLQIEIDSLYVGHRGEDTLLYTHTLRLRAIARTAGVGFTDILNTPIEVEELYLDETTFHSDSLIAAVGIDVVAGMLRVNSPGLIIGEGAFPLHGLALQDSYIAIDLRDTPPDTTEVDTTALRMAFHVPDGELKNVRFCLTPMDLDVQTDLLSVNTLADVGGNIYDVRQINLGLTRVGFGAFSIPVDTLYGDVHVDLDRNLITSGGLHARCDTLGAKLDVASTKFNMESMRADLAADAEFQGSKAKLRGYYDIDDELYDLKVDIERVDLSPFLSENTRAVIAGRISARGKGIDPTSAAMKSQVELHLQDAIYDNINVSGIALEAELARKTVAGTLHLPVTMRDSALSIQATTEHEFTVANFMELNKIGIDYHTVIRGVRAQVAGEDIRIKELRLNFATDTTTALDLRTEGLRMDVASPMHVMTLVDKVQPLLSAVGDSALLAPLMDLSDITLLDTLRRLIPDLAANLHIRKGSPAQPILEKMGLDIRELTLSLASDSAETTLALGASIPDIEHPEDSTALRLPAAKAALRVALEEGHSAVALTAATKLTDGAMTLHGLKTDADLKLDIERREREIAGSGRLKLGDLQFTDLKLGDRVVDLAISPSTRYANAIRADVRLDDIPMELVDSILQMPDIELKGAVRASAGADGLPSNMDISAEVLPLGLSALYKPYEVAISLGETPIIMEHNTVDLNGLPIYGADSTFLALSGGINLDEMYLDIQLSADSFAPVRLVENGPIPVYGDLATKIRGRVTGALDSILADVDLTILPTTDITYPIDKKNLAQVKPHGTVNVKYGVADGSLELGGQVNVDEGLVRYSPKAFPIMPFKIDSGSHIAFNGPIGQTRMNISASQKVKAEVQSQGEDSRRVEFTTGVRVKGVVDSISLRTVGFFLEAPKDETITRELASIDNDTREGYAATLLASGMYVGESNIAAQREGYALSSIVNSRINAAMANSKMGKKFDIDLSSGQTKRGATTSNDINLSISKSWLDDKLRLTLGSTLSDNPEINKSSSLLSNATLDYALTKNRNVQLRLFSKRDQNNVFEGELYKAGLGVRAAKDWSRKLYSKSVADSITHVYGLTADADIAYRSNNSIGPNLALTSSIKNLLGRDETFSIKGMGAYYWALRNRLPGDPKKTDTYKLGADVALIFPYLHWAGDNNPAGDTRYLVGYQYENIAGGYGVHKISGSFTYFIRQGKYITHSFTPFSLSFVKVNAENPDLMNKVLDYPQLIAVLAGDEFVPAIAYGFTYNDYRSKRAVNTTLDIDIKEAGNLINALYCAFGQKWNTQNKPLGKITYNQFVKTSVELKNKFNLTDKTCIATRIFAGANIPLGNSQFAPLSEAYYAGGPNSLRAAAPYSYGPGNFHSTKYNQNFFHAGDVKLEGNLELRFPIYWKLFGAAFVDAGNVWNWSNTWDLVQKTELSDIAAKLGVTEQLHDGILNPDFARQIALGTGAGLRLDLDGLVIRFDLGIGIHAPYQTYQYNRDKNSPDYGKPDYNKPITKYFNMPSALEAVRFNFGIGYPF